MAETCKLTTQIATDFYKNFIKRYELIRKGSIMTFINNNNEFKNNDDIKVIRCWTKKLSRGDKLMIKYYSVLNSKTSISQFHYKQKENYVEDNNQDINCFYYCYKMNLDRDIIWLK